MTLYGRIIISISLAWLVAVPGIMLDAQDIKGEVIGICESSSVRCGITDKGEVFSSPDGKDWKVIDFYGDYREYYGELRFVGIAAGTAGFAIAAVRTNAAGGETPAVFTSSKGTVWSERELTYRQGEEWFQLWELPLSISHDPVKDEFVLECTDETLFYIPGCSHCNRMTRK